MGVRSVSARATRANLRDEIDNNAATRSGKNVRPTSMYHYASRVVSMTGSTFSPSNSPF